MSLLKGFPLDEITAARLWAHLPLGVRAEAAASLYAHKGADSSAHQAGHAAIARALRFRDASVRKLPAEKKAAYLSRMTHLDEMLASGLLQALHLERRRELLTTLLDSLGVPHENGSIDENATIPTLDEARLAPGTEKLYASFPEEQVDVYLASLLAVDPPTWAGLRPLLARRAGA